MELSWIYMRNECIHVFCLRVCMNCEHIKQQHTIYWKCDVKVVCASYLLWIIDFFSFRRFFFFNVKLHTEYHWDVLTSWNFHDFYPNKTRNNFNWKNTVFDLTTKMSNFIMKIQAIETNLASMKLTLEN